MSPTAFTFNGIKVYIYTEDHLPIHIHAIYNEYESVYIIKMDAGKLVDVTLRSEHPNNLPPAQHKKVIKFLKKHYKLVVTKWTDLIVLGKDIKLTRISGL